MKCIPQPDSIGDWLRRMGISGVNAITLINQELCQIALGADLKNNHQFCIIFTQYYLDNKD